MVGMLGIAMEWFVCAEMDDSGVLEADINDSGFLEPKVIDDNDGEMSEAEEGASAAAAK